MNGSGVATAIVSIEVSPHLAYDTDRRWSRRGICGSRLQRPNIMIKVPATAQGLPVVRRLIAEGINVNVTLLVRPWPLPRGDRKPSWRVSRTAWRRASRWKLSPRSRAFS